MDSFFSEFGIRAFDFIQISAIYFVTMLNFFVLRDKKHQWINYLLLVTFVLQCIFFILFHDGLPVKLFAALMLISTLAVEAIVSRRRKLEDMERSAAK